MSDISNYLCMQSMTPLICTELKGSGKHIPDPLRFSPLIVTVKTPSAETEKNSIRDARTPQPGEIFFNTMRYRSSVTLQSSRYFQSSVSYIKVQIMLK